MEDARLWEFEQQLWTGDADLYRERVDRHCVMVVPAKPFLLSGSEAIEAVSNTPRWTEVEFSDQKVARPEEGLITIAYRAVAQRGDQTYEAYCTSTIRREAHDDWKVVQHSQMVPLALGT